MDRFPFQTMAYGWYPVLYSDDLGPGETKALHYFDREMIAWRETGGAAHVFDAYCPHLGANLNIGGRVEGERLRCPFHGFEYVGSGQCAYVPYSERINGRAVAETIVSSEKNGHIYVWYHPAGAAPLWPVPELPEWGSDGYTGYIARRDWVVKTAWHEIAEQIVDVGHTNPLHGVTIPHYDTIDVEGHVFQVSVRQAAADAPMGDTGDTLASTYYGPGIAFIRYHGSIGVCMVTSTIPISPEELVFRWGVMSVRRETREEEELMASLVLDGFATLFEQDIPIWEHKRWVARPALVPEDGDIPRFRKWARQFHIDAATQSEVSGSATLTTAAV